MYGLVWIGLVFDEGLGSGLGEGSKRSMMDGWVNGV